MSWAPTWDLVVNGKLLPPDYKALVQSVTVQATVDGADELVITATGWDGDANTYKLLGETILAPGNSVVARMGYTDGDVVALQRFRLLREETQYTEGRRPQVRIRGYSAEHRLVERTGPGVFEAGVTDAEIVRLLAQFHGLSTTADSVQDTGPRNTARVKPQGTTDWAFLQQLAVANGYGPPYVRYDEDTDTDVLYFRATSLEHQADIGVARFAADPHQAGSDQASGSLLSFSPVLSLAGVPTRVEVVGWDPVKQEPIKVTVEITEGDQQTTIQTGDQVGTLDEGIRSGAQLQVVVLNEGQDVPELEKREVVAVQTEHTTEGARSFAERWLRTRLLAFMVARAKVIGWEHLWIAQIHRFVGLAPHHEGLWEVQTCTHSMTSQGYRCELDLTRVLEDNAEEPREV